MGKPTLQIQVTPDLKKRYMALPRKYKHRDLWVIGLEKAEAETLRKITKLQNCDTK